MIKIGGKVIKPITIDKSTTRPLSGVIVYIHPEGRYYTAEFETDGGKLRESFPIPDGEGFITAKGFLMRARRLDARLKTLREARELAWSRATSVTPKLSKAAAKGADISRKPEDFSALAAECEKQERELDSVQAEILSVISEIPDNTLAALLTAYYVNGETWEEVAVELHYSFYHVVTRLHPKALDAVTEILNKRFT